MSEEDFWNRLEKLEGLVEALVEDGVLDVVAHVPAVESALRYACGLGHLPALECGEGQTYAAAIHARRAKLANEYIEYCRAHPSRHLRIRKLRELSVTAAQVQQWAQQYYPDVLLSLHNTSLPLLLEYVSQHPSCTAAEILKNTSLRRTTVSTQLAKLTKKGVLVRYRSVENFGPYVYRLAGVAP